MHGAPPCIWAGAARAVCQYSAVTMKTRDPCSARTARPSAHSRFAGALPAGRPAHRAGHQPGPWDRCPARRVGAGVGVPPGSHPSTCPVPTVPCSHLPCSHCALFPLHPVPTVPVPTAPCSHRALFLPQIFPWGLKKQAAFVSVNTDTFQKLGVESKKALGPFMQP